MKVRKTVSPAVVKKNRRNAQQSTGPKTPEGKRNSRFNALKHGLTAKVLRFTSDGEPADEGLAEIFGDLQERYGSNDILGKLLIDCAVADYWRLAKGFELEVMHFIRNDKGSFHPKGETQNILRYNTAHRRALLKNLELLEQMQAAASDVPTEEAEHMDIEDEDYDIEDEDYVPVSDDEDASAVRDGDAAATNGPKKSDVLTELAIPESAAADAGTEASEDDSPI